MANEASTCSSEQPVGAKLLIHTDEARTQHASPDTACAVRMQLAVRVLCSNIQLAEESQPAKAIDHLCNLVPQECYQQQVQFSDPVAGRYSYMGSILTRAQKDQLFDKWLGDYPWLPYAVLEARDSAHVKKASKQQARTLALSFHETQCQKYRQRCWIALNRRPTQASKSDPKNTDKSVPRLPAYLGAAKPGLTAGARIPKQLQGHFRVDMYGNIVAKDAHPGSLCYWDVDHLFPRERGGASLPQNFVATHWYAKQHVKAARLLPTIMIDKLGVNPLTCGVTESTLQHLWDACKGLPSALEPGTSHTQLLCQLLCTDWIKSYDPKHWFDHKTGLLHTTPPQQLFSVLFKDFQRATTAMAASGQVSLVADRNNGSHSCEQPSKSTLTTAAPAALVTSLSSSVLHDSQQEVSKDVLGIATVIVPAAQEVNNVKSGPSAGHRGTHSQSNTTTPDDHSTANAALLRQEVARSQPTSPMKPPRARMLSATTQTQPCPNPEQQANHIALLDVHAGTSPGHMQPVYGDECDILEGVDQIHDQQEAGNEMQNQSMTDQPAATCGSLTSLVYSPPQSPLVAMVPPRPRNPTAYPYITEAYDFTGAASAGSSTKAAGILQTALHDRHSAKQADEAATAVCSAWAMQKNSSPCIAGGHFWLPEAPEVQPTSNPVVIVATDANVSYPRMPEPGPHIVTVQTPSTAVNSYSLLPVTSSSPTKAGKHKQPPTSSVANTGILPAQPGSPASKPITINVFPAQETTVQVMARGLQTSTHQAMDALHKPIQHVSNAWVKHLHKRIEANRLELARYGNVSSMPLWPGGPVPLTNPYLGPGQPHPAIVDNLSNHHGASLQSPHVVASPKAVHMTANGVAGMYVSDTMQYVQTSSVAANNASQLAATHAATSLIHTQQPQQACVISKQADGSPLLQQGHQMMTKLQLGGATSSPAAVTGKQDALSVDAIPVTKSPASAVNHGIAALQNTVATSQTRPSAGSTVSDQKCKVQHQTLADKSDTLSLVTTPVSQLPVTLQVQQAQQLQWQQGQASTNRHSLVRGQNVPTNAPAIESMLQPTARVAPVYQNSPMVDQASAKQQVAIDKSTLGNIDSTECRSTDGFDSWMNQQRQDVDDELTRADSDVQYVPQWQVSQSDNLSTAADSPRGPHVHDVPPVSGPNTACKASSGEYRRRSRDMPAGSTDNHRVVPNSHAANSGVGMTSAGQQPRHTPPIIHKQRNQQVITENDLPAPAFHRHQSQGSQPAGGILAHQRSRLSKGAKKAVKGVVKQFANLNPFKGFNKPAPEQPLAIGILPVSLEAVTEEHESDIQDAEGGNSPTTSPKKSSPSKSWFSRRNSRDEILPKKANETAADSIDRHMSPAKRIVQATMDNMRGLVNKVRSPQRVTGISPVGLKKAVEPESPLRADVSKQAFTIPAVQPGQELHVSDVDDVSEHDRPSQLMQTIKSRGTQSGRLKQFASLSERKSASAASSVVI